MIPPITSPGIMGLTVLVPSPFYRNTARALDKYAHVCGRDTSPAALIRRWSCCTYSRPVHFLRHCRPSVICLSRSSDGPYAESAKNFTP